MRMMLLAAVLLLRLEAQTPTAQPDAAQTGGTQSAAPASADLNAQGMQALDQQHYDQAADIFRRAIAADPGDYGAHFNLGLAYSLSGKDALAIPEYRKTLELKPGIFQAELNLGRSLYNTQQFRDAAGAYAQAVVLKADSAPAELGLARSLAHSGQRAEAEPHYRKAASLDASNRDFLLELAGLHEEHNETAQAIAIYREFPENPGAQERLGVLFLHSGNAVDAIATLEPVVARSPSSANRLALAEAYAKAQQPAKAEPLAAAALAAEPNDYELRMFYGRLLRDQRKLPQAAEQFLASTKLKPDSVEAWTELAGMLVLTEQFPQALAALDRVHSLGGDTAGHYFLRALTQDRLQLRKEALENYQKFLASSQGKNPDEEFQARQRVRTLEKDLGRR
jgi:tetratricopeptide (TPR) repeat protein